MRRCGNCDFRSLKDIRQGGNLICSKTNEDVSPEGGCDKHRFNKEVIDKWEKEKKSERG